MWVINKFSENVCHFDILVILLFNVSRFETFIDFEAVYFDIIIW
jgi:hypothetical protein